MTGDVGAAAGREQRAVGALRERVQRGRGRARGGGAAELDDGATGAPEARVEATALRQARDERAIGAVRAARAPREDDRAAGAERERSRLRARRPARAARPELQRREAAGAEGRVGHAAVAEAADDDLLARLALLVRIARGDADAAGHDDLPARRQRDRRQAAARRRVGAARQVAQDGAAGAEEAVELAAGQVARDQDLRAGDARHDRAAVGGHGDRVRALACAGADAGAEAVQAAAAAGEGRVEGAGAREARHERPLPGRAAHVARDGERTVGPERDAGRPGGGAERCRRQAARAEARVGNARRQRRGGRTSGGTRTRASAERDGDGGAGEARREAAPRRAHHAAPAAPSAAKIAKCGRGTSPKPVKLPPANTRVPSVSIALIASSSGSGCGEKLADGAPALVLTAASPSRRRPPTVSNEPPRYSRPPARASTATSSLTAGRNVRTRSPVAASSATRL